MAASSLNQLETDAPGASTTPGDVPERLRRRYFTDERGGPGLGFYVDATGTAAAFRDQGLRLSTSRNDPNVIRDLVAIAGHRGWRTISVGGHTNFRREVWLAASASGLEVRGYQPTPRDEQDLARRLERTRRDEPPAAGRPAPDVEAPGAGDRLRVVEAVVRNRIAETSEQTRILAAARTRLSAWLERGARFETMPPIRARQRERSS